MRRTPGTLCRSVNGATRRPGKPGRTSHVFLELFMPCLEVCDDVEGSQYEIKVTI